MATHSSHSTTPRPSAGTSRPRRPSGGSRRPPTRHADRDRVRAAIPVSVWPPPRPIDADDQWPEPILQRLITTLCAPGERVALLTPDHRGAGQPTYGTAARAVVPPGTLAAAAETIEAHDRRPHIATWSAHAADTAPPYWVQFVDPTPQTTSAPSPGEPEPLPDAAPDRAATAATAGSASLVIAAVEPGAVGDGFGATAAALLRPGGTLAVITHCDHQGGRLVDPSGMIVAAAQNADLLYLQHVVALHHPIRDGRISGPTAPGQPQAPIRERHRRVHRDLYLFWKCAEPTAVASRS